MELEAHVHVQIEKQIGFHEHQIAFYHLGSISTFTSYEMEL